MSPGANRLPGTSFLLGFTSIIAQTLLLREFLVVLYGSELLLGAILAGWLVSTGLGGLIGARTPAPRGIGALQTAAALSLPAAILLIRGLRLWLPSPAGTYPGLLSSAGLSLLLAAAVGLPLGIWYSRAAALPSPGATGPGRAYAWEAWGGLAGGGVFSFLLAPHFDGLTIAASLSFLLLLRGAVTREGGASRRPRAHAAVSAVLAGALTAVWLWPGASWPTRSHRWRWPRFDVVRSVDTRYGNIALVRNGPQRTLFENGSLAFSFPDPVPAETLTHLAALVASSRRRVLVVGGGPAGAVRSALAYPVERVDYLELDPRTPEIAGASRALDDARIRFHAADGRGWLARERGPWDLVLISPPEPATAMANRYYTAEFFALVRSRLAPGGVLAFYLPSSANYFGEGMTLRNGSIWRALRNAFPAAAVAPTEPALFLARRGPAPIRLDPDRLGARLASEGISSDVVTPLTLRTLLDRERARFISESLESTDAPVNRDARPVAYFYHSLLWSELTNRAVTPALRAVLAADPLWLALVPPLLALGTVVLGWRRAPGRPRLSLRLAALTTGGTAMICQFLVLFFYQTERGFLFNRIGLLNGLFMAGLGAGGLLGLRARPGGGARRLLLRAEAALCAWPLVLGAVLALPAAVGGRLPGAGVDLLYGLLAAVTGLLAGMPFPLFTLAGSGERAAPGAAGGRFYFFDLAGAAGGVLLVSLWLLPLHGRAPALLLSAGCTGAALAALLLEERTES